MNLHTISHIVRLRSVTLLKCLAVGLAMLAPVWLTPGALAAGTLATGTLTLGGAKRIALVVGNSAYQTVPALANPANDAAATKVALERSGFEVVYVADANLAAMRATLDSFARKVEQAGAGSSAVVFYAGHAVQMAGVNYLLPVDIKPEKSTDMPALAVSLGDILKRLDATGATTKIVILDACRDNPFATAGKARGLAMALIDGAGRDDEAGLARIESKGGTLVAFSTSPGATAADGAGEHSPFAAAFLKLVREPGLPVEQLFRRVRLAVHDATGGEQTPWETSSLTADFKFVDGATPPAVPGTTVAGVDTINTGSAARLTRATFSGASAAAAYEKAIYMDSPIGYRLFLDIYPDDERALRISRMLTMRQEERAWAVSVRAGDAEALKLFMQLYPDSLHSAEAEALAAKAPRRLARTAALACPVPLAPTAPTAPAAPRFRKIDLPQPAPKPAPAPQPKERLRKAHSEPAPIRRRVDVLRLEADDEPEVYMAPRQAVDPAIPLAVIGGILGGVAMPHGHGGYIGRGGYGGMRQGGMRQGGSSYPSNRMKPTYNRQGDYSY